MIEQQFKCDVCAAQRGPENHWLIVGRRTASNELVLGPWEDHTAQDPKVEHICGAGCAHVVLDRYLESLRESKFHTLETLIEEGTDAI